MDMIVIAWRTGRGYTTLLILVASLILFELLVRALALRDGPWVFGSALIGAAAANWVIGRKPNRHSLAKVRSRRVRARTFYRARHRFMSLPMETFSIVLAAAGAALLATAAVRAISRPLPTHCGQPAIERRPCISPRRQD
jgi:hypothetical protein